MRTRYKIDNNYSAEDMRTIAGVRYEINARYSSDYSTASYVFVQDADMNLITSMLEGGVKCVNVRPRMCANTAPHTPRTFWATRA
jgi:hypothetical protein